MLTILSGPIYYHCAKGRMHHARAFPAAGTATFSLLVFFHDNFIRWHGTFVQFKTLYLTGHFRLFALVHVIGVEGSILRPHIVYLVF